MVIRRSGCLIAAPSANTSGRPSPTEAAHDTSRYLISFHYSTPSINLATKLNAAPSPDFLPPPSDILK